MLAQNMVQTPITGTHAPVHIAPDKSGLNRLLCSAKDRFTLSVLHFKMNVGAKQGSAPDHSRGASPIPLFLSQSLHSDNRVKQS